MYNWGAIWNSSSSGLKNQEYDRGDLLRSPRDTFYQQKLALTSPTRGDRSVGIVRWRTKATEFSFLVQYIFKFLNDILIDFIWIGGPHIKADLDVMGGNCPKGHRKKCLLVINVGNLCYDSTAFTKQIISMVEL
jgi:hypothetical protein